MRATLASLLALTALSGCAQYPRHVQMAYAPVALYDQYSCAELAIAADRVSRSAAVLSGYQRHRANNDGASVAVGLTFWWPAFFLVEGETALTASLSQLKGEAYAIHQAAIHKHCGFEFRTY